MCVSTKLKVLCWLAFRRAILTSAQNYEFTVDGEDMVVDRT